MRRKSHIKNTVKVEFPTLEEMFRVEETKQREAQRRPFNLTKGENNFIKKFKLDYGLVSVNFKRFKYLRYLAYEVLYMHNYEFEKKFEEVRASLSFF